MLKMTPFTITGTDLAASQDNPSIFSFLCLNELLICLGSGLWAQVIDEWVTRHKSSGLFSFVLGIWARLKRASVKDVLKL